jgi:hypothetical protein
MTTPPRSNRKKLWVAILGLAIIGVGGGAWMHVRNEHAAEHEHSETGTVALSLDDGRRWATDAPLRTGMQRIRGAANPLFAARTKGGVDATAAKAFSATVQQNVNYMFANCKLAPKADAALHVIITDLLSGAAQLAAHPESPEGFVQISAALRSYPQYFDDPQWEPLAFDMK